MWSWKLVLWLSQSLLQLSYVLGKDGLEEKWLVQKETKWVRQIFFVNDLWSINRILINPNILFHLERSRMIWKTKILIKNVKVLKSIIGLHKRWSMLFNSMNGLQSRSMWHDRISKYLLKERYKMTILTCLYK